MGCTIGVCAAHPLATLKPIPRRRPPASLTAALRFCRIGSAVGGPLQAFANWCASPAAPLPPPSRPPPMRGEHL